MHMMTLLVGSDKMFFKKNTVIKPIHNSIQIWYEAKGTDEAGLDLDINIWRLKSI